MNDTPADFIHSTLKQLGESRRSMAFKLVMTAEECISDAMAHHLISRPMKASDGWTCEGCKYEGGDRTRPHIHHPSGRWGLYVFCSEGCAIQWMESNNDAEGHWPTAQRNSGRHQRSANASSGHDLR